MLMRGKVTESRAQNKEFHFFFCRDKVTSPIFWQSYEKTGAQQKKNVSFFCLSAIYASKILCIIPFARQQYGAVLRLFAHDCQKQ